MVTPSLTVNPSGLSILGGKSALGRVRPTYLSGSNFNNSAQDINFKKLGRSNNQYIFQNLQKWCSFLKFRYCVELVKLDSGVNVVNIRKRVIPKKLARFV